MLSDNQYGSFAISHSTILKDDYQTVKTVLEKLKLKKETVLETLKYSYAICIDLHMFLGQRVFYKIVSVSMCME